MLSFVFILAGTFSSLRADLILSRKDQFYVLQVFVPSILLVLLSWVSFWVDASAVPARVSLGVTCVLTMTTQSSGTRQMLPPVSYVKAIDVWMFMCLLFVFAALLEFAYVNVLMRSKKKNKQQASLICIIRNVYTFSIRTCYCSKHVQASMCLLYNFVLRDSI